jgi:hypothetical protein
VTTEPEANDATDTLAVVISEPDAAASQPAAEAPAAVETAEIQP